jgi:hypothetical protein
MTWLAALWLGATLTLAGECPPIQRLVWRAPQRIRWEASDGPMWFSVGHLNRVLCCIPRGATVDFEVREVTGFDGLPATTRLLTNRTVRADDPDARKRKQWEFPKEMGKFDWELKALPAQAHQTLFRLFLHDDPQLWQTLLVHTEADATFKDFQVYVIVCELLHDPTLKLTSTYREPDDPPATNWIAQQKIKAPWASQKAKLEPARGRLVIDTDGTMKFLPAPPEKRKLKFPALEDKMEGDL